ncbi:tryptophan--tRNA ligase [Pelagibacteraceae bacterium]|nr:tryptophan--tRNA ligase [Pelagibacteraceae bacterium]
MEKPIKRILSGVQPSGDLHLGNYLGAIKNFVTLQKEYECFFCVVDLHAITVWQDPKVLANKTREVTAAFIASGIDPNQNNIFVQSQVPQHAQLGWLFNCVARMGWLNRMTQFKDKAGKNSENVSVGLFSYPTLMAADILIYLATHVPVGDDQKQHLELTRDIAQKFNNDFKTDFFPIPEPLILGEATRVMSLRDGSKKMSKSDPSDYSRIMLTDTAENITQKIKKAKTDPEPLPQDKTGLEKRPEAENLISIFASLQDTSIESVIKDYAGKEFSIFKKDLADLSVSKLEPITSEMNKLVSDVSYIDSILNQGKENAIAVAEPVLQKTKEIIGFLS